MGVVGEPALLDVELLVVLGDPGETEAAVRVALCANGGAFIERDRGDVAASAQSGGGLVDVLAGEHDCR